MSPELNRWRSTLDLLGPRNRVHAGADTSLCYRQLAAAYPNTRILDVASGECSGGWRAPPAWEVDEATLVGPGGEVIADWGQQPLSLFTYSPPFRGVVDRDELEHHLMSVPALPDRTPFHFRNQYRHWAPEWGFCLPHAVRERLPPGPYRVDIRTRFEAGRLEMVEQTLEGENPEALLLVGHFDHPYMVLDGLIGCLAGHEIVTRLGAAPRRLTYRMLSTVEIVGSVFYAERWARQGAVKEALFVATAGADAPLCYQTSFGGASAIDRAMRHILSFVAPTADVAPFRRGKLGNDETAFDVAGVDISCGSIMRAPFNEYHTDADCVAAVLPDHVEAMIALVLRAINVLERNAVLERGFEGLPCLSAPEFDLYISGAMMSQATQEMNETTRRFVDSLAPAPRREAAERHDAMAWMMNILPAMVDGRVTTLDVAEKVGLPFEVVDSYTEAWVEKRLLKKTWKHPFR